MWIEFGGFHGVWYGTKHSIIYFDTSKPGVGPWPAKPQFMPTNGVWTPVDLTGYVPEDTKFVGLRIWPMLGGAQPTTMNISVAFRAGSDTIEWGAAAQAHGATERQQTNVWVPLDAAHTFEYKVAWDGPTSSAYTYGVNMELMEYLR